MKLIKITLLLFILTTCSKPEARSVESSDIPGDPNIIYWDNLILEKSDFKYPDKMRAPIVNLLNSVILYSNTNFYYITSDYRNPNHTYNLNMYVLLHDSQHHYGLAVDFILDDYTNMDECVKFKTYYNRMTQILAILEDLNVSSKIGFGIYLDAKYTPFFHLDTRGWEARWARDFNGNYIGFSQGVKLLENKLRECYAISLYPKPNQTLLISHK